MARIPVAELEQLKTSIPLAEVVRSSGVALKRHGDSDLIGHCPFHNDKTPSLVVTPQKNLWNCLGACGIGGSVIDWAMKNEGLGFREAVDLLKERFGNSLAAVEREPLRARNSGLLQSNADERQLLKNVCRFYHEKLFEQPNAVAYLESRGLNDKALIKRFQLGFSDRSLGSMLPKKERVEGGKLRKQLQSLGLMRESGHEHFRGCIVIPVININGEITEIYGRRINRARNGALVHTYLRGPHRGVFNESGIKETVEAGNRTVILCESLIDALSFIRHGFDNVTSSFGVNGFTAEHFKVLVDYNIDTLLIAYDADEAGDTAAEKLARSLSDKLPTLVIKRVRFPKGADANSFALQMEPARRALKLCLNSADHLYGLEETQLKVGVAAAAESAHSPSLQSASPKVLAVQELPRSPTPKDAPHSSHPRQEAACLPPPLPAEPDTLIEGDEVRITFGKRLWRMRGLFDNQTNATLKVNLACFGNSAQSTTEHLYIDSLDLYLAKARYSFVRYCAEELEEDLRVIKSDMAKVLRHAETLWLRRRTEGAVPDVPEMSAEEKQEALELLCDPKLIERIIADFRACGMVGEDTNKLVGYLAATSRKLRNPLAVIIQSTSAAGKSSLMDAVLQMMPDEERVQYSAMTGQSVFYLGETNLKHKILAVSEEEGADKASYALKMLQSEGELSIASTGKDPKTGRLLTQEYRVEGPVMLFSTTTAIDIDEEYLNRCIVLSVDEGREQTRAIHDAQRHARTITGIMKRHAAAHILKRHQNAQRLLEPVAVANPFAETLTFADFATRTRRDNKKYLTLIDVIAFLHQHQRERKSEVNEHTGEIIEYVEVTQADIELANGLADHVLLHSLEDIPPQTKRLMGLIEKLVSDLCALHQLSREEVRFSRRHLREHSGWSLTQVRVHLERLVDYELITQHSGRKGKRFEYGLAYYPTSLATDGSTMRKPDGVAGTWRGGIGQDKALKVESKGPTCRPDGDPTTRVKKVNGRLVDTHYTSGVFDGTEPAADRGIITSEARHGS